MTTQEEPQFEVTPCGAAYDYALTGMKAVIDGERALWNPDDESLKRRWEILAFLVRGYRAARSLRLLLVNGERIDAKGVGRTLVETTIELLFIASDAAQTEARLDLFYNHSWWNRRRLATAIDALHGGSGSSEALRTIEAEWSKVKEDYPRATRNSWHGAPYENLFKRAEAAALAADPSADSASIHEYFHRLSFGFGCTAAHPTAISFERDLEIDPEPLTDGEDAQFLSEMGMFVVLLTEAVAEHLGHDEAPSIDRYRELSGRALEHRADASTSGPNT